MPEGSAPFRIVTYNIRHGLGADRRVSTSRIAAVLAPLAPDIVALQEVDRGRRRSGCEDQSAAIARALGMQAHFHPAMRHADGYYGDSILTRAPSRLARAGSLPSPGHVEARGALRVEIDLGGTKLQVICTHLGVRRSGRLVQVDGLIGAEWLGAALAAGPTLLAGDFNSIPRSAVYRRIRGSLVAAGADPAAAPAPPTFPARLPVLRLDHVFAGPGIRLAAPSACRSALARIASDHLPLWVDFHLDPACPGS